MNFATWCFVLISHLSQVGISWKMSDAKKLTFNKCLLKARMTLSVNKYSLSRSTQEPDESFYAATGFFL